MTVVKFADEDAGGEVLPAASKGAFAEFKTCIILGSLKWEISTIIPKRFISLRTIWSEREKRNEFYANLQFFSTFKLFLWFFFLESSWIS